MLLGGEYLSELSHVANMRAIICALDIKAPRPRGKDDFFLTGEESAQELARLAETLGLEVVDTIIQDRYSPDSATYLGKGKVQEVGELVSDHEVSYVLIDDQLSPSQTHNLEEALGVEVLDRTKVILRIFAQRAKTKEGKLQVELATRRHELTRLTGHGTVMSSLGGGIGTRGPGEQKLEVDRRVLRRKISQLTKSLDKARKVRKEQSKRRRESSIPKISLIGYTNAGKSTLFKALTGEDVLCDDRLFATLDPWTRRWFLPSGMETLISDTVGFIQGLPHELVYAFRSTLEESLDADLLVHVVDVSSPVWEQQIRTVEKVLEELGASDRSIITVLNKSDKVSEHELKVAMTKQHIALHVSALSGYGISKFATTVERHLLKENKIVSLIVPYAMWNILFEIRKAGAILQKIHGKSGAEIICKLDPVDAVRFSKRLSG